MELVAVTLSISFFSAGNGHLSHAEVTESPTIASVWIDIGRAIQKIMYLDEFVTRWGLDCVMSTL